MRALTLNEKISLRGPLVKRGVPGKWLLKGEMKQYLFHWRLVMPRSISEYYRFINK